MLFYRRPSGIFVYTTALEAFHPRWDGRDVVFVQSFGMPNFRQGESAAPLATSRPILSPSFLLIGAAIVAVVLLLTFRLAAA